MDKKTVGQAVDKATQLVLVVRPQEQVQQVKVLAVVMLLLVKVLLVVVAVLLQQVAVLKVELV